MKFDIALARFPGDGRQQHELEDWLVTTVLAMKQDEHVGKITRLKYPYATPVPCLRNQAVLDARTAGAKYLLMVDSDMVPDLYPEAPPFWDTAWKFLMDRKEEEYRLQQKGFGPPEHYSSWLHKNCPAATVAAPYCGPPPEENCYVFHWANRQSDHPNPDYQLRMIPREMAAVATGIQEVAALPTGLILYDMRVFDLLPVPWFRYEYRNGTENEKVTTEDVYQTRNASLLKLPQFVAWDSWAGHAKIKVVGKPRLVTRDQVHHSLVAAVERGLDRGDQLVLLPEHEDPAP